MKPLPIRAAVLLLLSVLLLGSPAALAQYRFDGVSRVVAVGDVHGAYAELTGLLTELGLIDDSLRWQGGDTHLVSTGDLLDRGDQGREVLDLFMRLEGEAAAAGGAVHVLLGNHEIMNLTGDLRYVSEGDYARFGGYEARREALSAQGDYGRWLLSRPVMVVVNDTLFVHGGLSEQVHGKSLDTVNREAARDIRLVMDGWHTLRAEGALAPDDDFRALRARAPALAEAAEDPAVRSAAQGAVRGMTGLPFAPDGTAWYRGSSLCHPYAETAVVRAALASLGAARVAVGHTVTQGRRMTTRLGGRVLRMDTGMNTEAYGGHPAALVIEGGSVRVYYAGSGFEALAAEPNRVWARPYGMSDEAIERFLATAAVVRVEDLASGVTRPRRLTLEQDGRTMRAAFKVEDTDPGLESARWSRQAELADRYIYDVAAYHLDRIIGLDMSPVAVVREIDGERGAVVFWLENTFTENNRRERDMEFDGHCPLAPQYDLMNLFDVLVYNVDRNLGNILYDRDWSVWLIDYTRAFGTRRDLPRMIRDVRLKPSEEFRNVLEDLSSDDLAPLRRYLHANQVRAIIQRARRLQRLR